MIANIWFDCNRVNKTLWEMGILTNLRDYSGCVEVSRELNMYYVQSMLFTYRDDIEGSYVFMHFHASHGIAKRCGFYDFRLQIVVS